ncbi:MAG: MFS transporter [Actinomycetota bacterium]
MSNDAEVAAIPRASWWTLGITSVASFMVSMEITVIALAFDDIQESFDGVSRSTLSWIFTAYNIGVAALLLLAGWAADRFGRKRLFLMGLWVFLLGSVASGFSVDAPTLIAARVLQSIGGAMQGPAGLALLLPAFPIERRGMAVGTWGAMGALAAALGPTIGAVLINLFGWRSVFLVNVPVALVAIALGARHLTESRSEDLPDRVDAISVPMASVGVGLLVLAIAQTESWGVVSLPILVALVASALLLTLFVRRSQRHPAPLFDLDLMRRRSYSVGLLGTVFFSAAFFGWFVVLPSFLIDSWEWSILQAGLALVPGPALAAFVSPAVGRLADRHGVGVVLTIGGISGVIGLAWHLVFTGEEPALLMGILIPELFVGVSAGCSFAMLVAAAMRDIPPQRFGMAGAGRTTVFQLAVAIGIAIGAAVVGDPESIGDALSRYRLNWVIALIFFAAQAVVFAVAYPSEESREPAERASA